MFHIKPRCPNRPPSQPTFSRIQNSAAVLVVFLAGCASGPSRNSSESIADIAQHAENHRGQLLSSGGQLLFMRQEGASWMLRIATPNYRHLFEVRISQDPGELKVGQDVAFLGTLFDTRPMREAYSGEILVINAAALKPVSHPAIIVTGQEALADSWLRGSLDLTASRTDVPLVAHAPASIEAFPQSVKSERTSEQSNITPVVTSKPEPARPVTALTPAVSQMLREWSQLSDAERADFLQRTGNGR